MTTDFDLNACIVELHEKLYLREVFGRACSDRADILYHFLKYHNQKPSVVRYERKDDINIILLSGETHHQSHVVVILDNWILDSNFEEKWNKKTYIKKLQELNENQIIDIKNYKVRDSSYFIDIVRNNLSPTFQGTIKSKRENKKSNKAIWIGTLVGFLIGLINLFLAKTKLTLVYPIALALKFITNCSGPCWGLILYSGILTLSIWILIGIFVGFIIKKIKK